jgi:hypothetical protein
MLGCLKAGLAMEKVRCRERSEGFRSERANLADVPVVATNLR